MDNPLCLLSFNLYSFAEALLFRIINALVKMRVLWALFWRPAGDGNCVVGQSVWCPCQGTKLTSGEQRGSLGGHRWPRVCPGGPGVPPSGSVATPGGLECSTSGQRQAGPGLWGRGGQECRASGSVPSWWQREASEQPVSRVWDLQTAAHATAPNLSLVGLGEGRRTTEVFFRQVPSKCSGCTRGPNSSS